MSISWSAAQAIAAAKGKRTAEDVEADVRVLMAKHAAIEARGWQTAKDREIIRRKIDGLLDEHRYLVMLGASA